MRKVLLDGAFHAKVLEPQFYTVIANSPGEFAEFLERGRAFVAELERVE